MSQNNILYDIEYEVSVLTKLLTKDANPEMWRFSGKLSKRDEVVLFIPQKDKAKAQENLDSLKRYLQSERAYYLLTPEERLEINMLWIEYKNGLTRNIPEKFNAFKHILIKE